jgi:hypothetical protein
MVDLPLLVVVVVVGVVVVVETMVDGHSMTQASFLLPLPSVAPLRNILREMIAALVCLPQQ